MCLFQFQGIFTLQRTLTKQYGCFKLVHFPKKLGCQSSASPEILASGSHCSANSQPILDCFLSNFKLKYEDSQNIKADSVNRIVFNLHQIKRQAFFMGHPVVYRELRTNCFRLVAILSNLHPEAVVTISKLFPRKESWDIGD